MGLRVHITSTFRAGSRCCICCKARLRHLARRKLWGSPSVRSTPTWAVWPDSTPAAPDSDKVCRVGGSGDRWNWGAEGLVGTHNSLHCQILSYVSGKMAQTWGDPLVGQHSYSGGINAPFSRGASYSNCCAHQTPRGCWHWAIPLRYSMGLTLRYVYRIAALDSVMQIVLGCSPLKFKSKISLIFMDLDCLEFSVELLACLAGVRSDLTAWSYAHLKCHLICWYFWVNMFWLRQ